MHFRCLFGLGILFWLVGVFPFGIHQAAGAAQDTVVDKPVIPQDTLGDLPLQRSPLPGFSRLPTAPADNPLTQAKADLGRRLFFDPILSGDGTVACASCHFPNYGLANSDRYAVGIRGQKTRRNSPSLFNVGYGRAFFWDGRAATLEEQALVPITHPQELGAELETVIRRLKSHSEYPILFGVAFGEIPRSNQEQPGDQPFNQDDVEIDWAAHVNETNLARAIASFERTLVKGNSSVDRFHAAEYEALNPAARQGLWIFESRGSCWQCHSGENFTDEDFHNTGVGFGAADRDQGRFDATGKDEDRFKFKTPSLRGLTQTAPYMHDGSMSKLEDVIEFYSEGGSRKDERLDPRLKPLNLSAADKSNLLEFLKALSH